MLVIKALELNETFGSNETLKLTAPSRVDKQGDYLHAHAAMHLSDGYCIMTRIYRSCTCVYKVVDPGSDLVYL